MRKTKHWCITVDHLDDLKSSVNKTEEMTIPFRLYDDDDELYYSGWMTPEYLNSSDPFGPLDWGMYDSGCTSMEYKVNGEWKIL